MTREKEKQDAIEILNRYGSVDGQKHITQLIFFAEGMESRVLTSHWKQVEKDFKNFIKER